MMRLSSGIRSALICAFLLAPALTRAQQMTTEQNLKHGEEIFAQTCTQSYCHGANGAAGGAPRLAGRGLTGDYIERVVTYGISGTPMPAWGQILPLTEVRSVIAYVQSLNGVAPSMRSGPPPTLTEDAAHGRDLFFDPQHAVRCSFCHRVNDRGQAVAPIANIPADANALRDLETPQVGTAPADAGAFPALLSSKIPGETKIYDLTKFPPVLRTFNSGSVEIKSGNAWKHSTVLGSYSDDDLRAILLFLRASRQ